MRTVIGGWGLVLAVALLVSACGSGPEVREIETGDDEVAGVSVVEGEREAVHRDEGGGMASGVAEVVDVGDLAALLPSRELLPGWSPVRKPQRYRAETLSDHVDGAAPLFLDYGFQELIVAEYAGPSGASFLLEIYRMSSDLNAFGIYSQAREGASNFLKIGNEAFASSSSLEFWDGPCYVRLVSWASGPGTVDILMAYAANVAARIDAPARYPAELTVFPPGGRTPHSSQYVAKGALGVTGLDGYFAASYVEGASTCWLYLRRDDDADALRRDLGLLAARAHSAEESDGYLLFELPHEGRGFAFIENDWAGIAIGNGTDDMKKALCLAAILRLPKPADSAPSAPSANAAP